MTLDNGELYNKQLETNTKKKQNSVYFIYSHSLMYAKINSVLNLCHDQAILNSVQCIIQNMIACEDASQQQLSYLQSKSHDL